MLARVREFAEANGLKLGQVAQPLRVALTGSTASPGIFEVLAVLGLDLDPPSQAARARKRGLWMAAKNASVCYVQEVPPDTLGAPTTTLPAGLQVPAAATTGRWSDVFTLSTLT